LASKVSMHSVLDKGSEYLARLIVRLFGKVPT
jgi:hypothetical protein